MSTSLIGPVFNEVKKVGKGLVALNLSEAADIAYSFIIGLSATDGQLLEDWLLESSNNVAAYNLYILENSVRSDDVLSLYGPMKAIANSPTAITNMMNNTTVRTKLAASNTGMQAVAESSTAMNKSLESQMVLEDFAASQAAMDFISTRTVAMNVVSGSTLAKDIFIASSVAMAAINASDMAIGKMVAGSAGLVPSNYTSMTGMANDQVVMDAVVASADAMDMVVASQAALDALVSVQLAIDTVVTGQLALDRLTANVAAMDTVSASLLARNTITSSVMAMDTVTVSDMAVGKLVAGEAGLVPSSYADMTAVAADQTAMDGVSASQDARDIIEQSDLALGLIRSSSMAIGKYVVGLAGLDPVNYLDMDAVVADSVAMDSIVGSQPVMTIVTSSTPAIDAISSSIEAKRSIFQNAAAYDIYASSAKTAAVKQDFESVPVGTLVGGTPGWNRTPESDQDWLVHTGPPASSGSTDTTGPDSAHEGVNYAYCETSNPVSGTRDYFEINFPMAAGSSGILSLYHFANGVNIGTFSVRVFEGGAWNIVYSYSGQRQSSPTASWDNLEYEFSNASDIKITYQHSGTGYYGDMAIDKLEVMV